ncbi:MAG: hypothetical protein CR968_00860 [Flavobacteriia bacterium]|nr:MAG: hypothetical protein CR968_00860 [Flavobacteriia bacterium]
MVLLSHHIYEYKKGLRNLVLHTASNKDLDKVIKKLDGCDIPYLVKFVSKQKVNVFFGDQVCLEIVKGFIHKKLTYLTPEEDFILGTMLGYNRLQQCNRYINRKDRQFPDVIKLTKNGYKNVS